MVLNVRVLQFLHLLGTCLKFDEYLGVQDDRTCRQAGNASVDFVSLIERANTNQAMSHNYTEIFSKKYNLSRRQLLVTRSVMNLIPMPRTCKNLKRCITSWEDFDMFNESHWLPCQLSPRDIFSDFQNLLSMLHLSDVALYFNKTEEAMHNIILCFGEKIPVVAFTELPKFDDLPRFLTFTLLMLLFPLSIFGNLVLFASLLPTRLIFKRIRFLLGVVVAKLQTCFSNTFRTNKTAPTTATSRKRSEPRLSKAKIAAKVTIVEQKRVSSSDFYFWVSAIIDLAWSAVVIPLHAILVYNNHFWVFNDASCKVYGYMSYLIICISSLILVTIAVDRYVSIMLCFNPKSPLKYVFYLLVESTSSRLQAKSQNSLLFFPLKTFLFMCVLLIASLLLTMPYLIYTRKTYVVNGLNCMHMTDKFMCVNHWYKQPELEFVYKLSFFILIFLVPGVVLCITYGSISYHLFKKNKVVSDMKSTSKPSEETAEPEAGSDSLLNEWRNKSKKRVIKLLIADCMFHIICWFPFSIFIIIRTILDHLGLSSSRFQVDLTVFIYLYTFAIMNVSLKWLFRLFGTWPKLSSKLSKFVSNMISRKNTAMTRANTTSSQTSTKPVQIARKFQTDTSQKIFTINSVVKLNKLDWVQNQSPK